MAQTNFSSTCGQKTGFPPSALGAISLAAAAAPTTLPSGADTEPPLWQSGGQKSLEQARVRQRRSQVVKTNLGLLDQVAALHWIREHIRSFGGDPSRVTLMGAKRAAPLVNLLMLSPLAKGKLLGRACKFAALLLSSTPGQPAGCK